MFLLAGKLRLLHRNEEISLKIFFCDEIGVNLKSFVLRAGLFACNFCGFLEDSSSSHLDHFLKQGMQDANASHWTARIVLDLECCLQRKSLD